MDKENNVVYVETKKGIFKCYKSEQMHKPIYYPIESKTNGYIDYNDVIRILNIDDLYEQVKKQKEVVDKAVADYEKTRFEKEQLNSLVNSCQEEIRQLKKELHALEISEEQWLDETLGSDE